MQWVKLFTEWPFDPKVQTMTEAMQCRHAKLIALRGTMDLSTLTEAEIAAALRISLRELRKTHALFVKKGFIEDDWSMPKWEARQTPTDPTAAERMRRYRANHPRNSDRNGSVTVTPRARAAGESLEEPRSGTDKPTTGGARPPERSRNGPIGPDPTGPDRSAEPAPPEVMEAARMAADRSSPEWGAWVIRMWRAGYPAPWILDAFDKVSARGQLRYHLAEGILRSYREQGGPDRPAGGPPPPVQPRPLEPPRFIPEGPEGDAIRAMYRKEDPP